ncbi:hypothetical protein MJD09_12845, partial [bacterium]|nr:hypothetical protein [bacterium]
MITARLPRLAISVVLLWASESSMAGDISGGVSGTLSLANSPYTVTGDLIVPTSLALKIEPGVVLQFQSD